MDKRLPRMAKVGMWTAWTLATLLELDMLRNPAAGLVMVLIFAAVGFGLRFGMAWSGYAGALFVAAWTVFGLTQSSALGFSQWMVALVLAAAAVVLYLAGRSLSPRRAWAFH
jgi:hypothetical protein